MLNPPRINPQAWFDCPFWHQRRVGGTYYRSVSTWELPTLGALLRVSCCIKVFLTSCQTQLVAMGRSDWKSYCGNRLSTVQKLYYLQQLLEFVIPVEQDRAEMV
ncbi:MAG: hypothetical protein BRC37_16310 [Cyanobacteria bacterium QH_3_48_40]|nr:MAG: hypothetical protein BRC37_16310 [Cyanobacteria bacterium QH_3_48_40]